VTHVAKAITVIIFSVFLISGCAVPTSNKISNQPESLSWRGRLAVRIEAEPSQSFSAGFELTGTATAGELILYTPLGSTAASLVWSPQTAVLRANDDIRYFDSLDALIEQALGTNLPAPALFSWLAGDNRVISGWSADLSQYENGRITARRLNPAPITELRLVLEK
jgi:outer membrane lipoprotein LolB